MPGLVPGIHAFLLVIKQDVDGRDKPGHDALRLQMQLRSYSAAARFSPACAEVM